jgi:hypothetical protein
MGEVRGKWEPIISTEQFHRGIYILHKHDSEKSRMKKHYYLLTGLLWVKAGGKLLSMFGSTPTGKYHSYSYYITSKPIDGKVLHLPCMAIEDQVQTWLQGISVNSYFIPSIRDIYQKEVTRVATNDKETKLTGLHRQITILKEEEARLGRLFITEKITETAYNLLHSEWQEKLRNAELNLAEMEREANICLNDLDMALVLMTKISELYPRLDIKQKSSLLQILAKRIIVATTGEIIDYELNSPFVYLRALADDLITPGNREECSSEQIHDGAQISRTRAPIRG